MTQFLKGSIKQSFKEIHKNVYFIHLLKCVVKKQVSYKNSHAKTVSLHNMKVIALHKK